MVIVTINREIVNEPETTPVLRRYLREFPVSLEIIDAQVSRDLTRAIKTVLSPSTRSLSTCYAVYKQSVRGNIAFRHLDWEI